MRPVTDAEYEALAEFRYALRRFQHFSEETAKSLGLTAQQHQALLVIKGFGRNAPVTIKILAERLLIQHNSAVGLVDRLEAMRLIERKTNSEDRRRITLTITSSGEALLEKLTRAHKKELRQIAPKLRPLVEQMMLTENDCGD